jgi:hypothetical protein
MTKQEEQFCIDNFHKMSTKAICRALEKNDKTVRDFLRSKGLYRQPLRPKTAAFYAEVAELYRTYVIRDIAKMLNRSERIVRAAVKVQNLRERGWQPANSRIASTQFKKGGRPENSYNQGKVVLRIGKKTGKRYWIKWDDEIQPVHYVVWSKHNGKPVPNGHVIRFIDGNFQNLAIENLALVTKQQNLLMNTKFKYKSERLFEVSELASRLHCISKSLINNK